MNPAQLKLPAIVVAAVAGLPVGGLCCSRRLFAGTRMGEAGVSEAPPKRANRAAWR